MVRDAPGWRVPIVGAVLIVAVLASAQAQEVGPRPIPPVPPAPHAPLAPPAPVESPKWRALERAGIGLYIAGAILDLYTTKRAMDAGLHETNPLMNLGNDPRATLASAAAVKIGFVFVLDRATRRSGGATRGAWLVGGGAFQIGAAISNYRAIDRARETSSPIRPPSVGIPVPAPGPLDRIGSSTFRQTRRRDPDP